jgi:CheY-like chemotaxis protein
MALIVVVDDEYLLAMILSDILEEEGHEVVMASHGQDALERIRSRRPALVITDFMMPVMTGLELAEAIKADDEISDLPIILMSGAQGDIGRKRSDIFTEVLDKPYSREDLLAAVNRIIVK